MRSSGTSCRETAKAMRPASAAAPFSDAEWLFELKFRGLRLTAHALKIRAFWGLPFVFGLLANEVDPVKIDRWADALLADARVRRDAERGQRL